uniref:Ig-like domain-containing protein n=1 Tax=Amphiprion ocellaris TaxID=80972 RepID=A0AAQ5Y300_AMPOC
MRKFTFIAALLCTVSWISVSVSEYLTVKVLPGEEVTLTCNNFSTSVSGISWYRLISGACVSCISSMRSSKAEVLLCEGFHKDKFHMTSKITKLFLTIKSVDISDSGLYFCGCCKDDPSVLYSPQYLNVQGDTEFDDTDCTSQKKPDENTNLMGVILAALTVFLVMVVIGLVVKIRKLQKGTFENLLYLSYFSILLNMVNLGSDDLNYATVTFAKRGGRREMESNVVYAATR